MILIGDHQQLRPNPTVYELAKHYNLDVSLFERMVKNGMPFTRLRLQHRMRPEISKMLEHIYVNPKLENHESVMHFDNIKGVACNVFLVDHEQSEVGSHIGPAAGLRSHRSFKLKDSLNGSRKCFLALFGVLPEPCLIERNS